MNTDVSYLAGRKCYNMGTSLYDENVGCIAREDGTFNLFSGVESAILTREELAQLVNDLTEHFLKDN